MFKNYLADLFEETVASINFPNYQNFNDAAEAYFIQKIMVAIDKVALIKERRVKHNSEEWFDHKTSEAIINCDI